MKSIVLFTFVTMVAVVLALPAPGSRASQRSQQKKMMSEMPGNLIQTRQQAMAAQKMRNPHEGIFNQFELTTQVVQETREVVASLPAQSKGGMFIKSGPNPVRTNPSNNLIDKEIFATMANRGINPAPPASDEEFCRRVFLDITGRQPSPERLLKYVGDIDPKKKEKLIDELIGSEPYIDRWTQWMGDLTRNYTFAQDNSARDRNAQYNYLRDSITKNRSFNQIATDFITFTGFYDQGPGAFLVRPILPTEIPQDGYDELAAEVSRTFLGTQAVCISCHNGQNHLEQVNLYFTGKQRSDFWGLASFFAQTNYKFIGLKNEIVQISNIPGNIYDATTRDGMRPPRNGGEIEPVYPFNGAKPNANEERRVALARMITTDPQFARAFVNRVFAHFFVLGLVEPVDGFDLARIDPENPPPSPWELQPTHPILLRNLAKFFQDSNYDLRTLIKLITTSDAYALSSRYDETIWKEEYSRLYARKLVRRLSAEEVLDAITTSTFKPAVYAAMGFTKPFTSAMSLPGPEEPLFASYSNNSPKQSDDPYLVYRFLQTFGRGDRNLVSRSSTGSIAQALGLFNSELIINRINAPDALPTQLSKLLQDGKAKPEEAVAYLYLISLARQPSPAEIANLKSRITTGPVTISDLQWALFNRLDFIYNY